MYALTVSLVTGAIGASVYSSENQRVSGYASLWLVRSASERIEVGVNSEEEARSAFRVVLSEGSLKIRQWSEVRLSPGKSWSRTVSLSPKESAVRVKVRLFRGSSTAPYRTAYLRK
jgi:hypothetical protein